MSPNLFEDLETDTTWPEGTVPDGDYDHPHQFHTIGDFLRHLRGDRSLRRVQDQTGIAYSYLSNIERGSKRPGEKVLTRLADYHNVPLGELLKMAGIDKVPDADRHFAIADIRRSYRFVLDDPSLVGYQKPDLDLPIETQRFVVQLYEHFTGKRLLD
jgi:transcriptional regulator with XRE-family HTH domain